MNQEQLNSARLARWSQDGNAKLTLESASEWLTTVGLCGFLPSEPGATVRASLLEAVVGRPVLNPSADERLRANDLLARLVGNSAAVPLKTGPFANEQPDLVASPETFRYIYALSGNRNFKGDPPTTGNAKITMLALHCWQAIERQGPADIGTLQAVLGQETTEAAVLRALHELWVNLYVFPSAAGDGSPTRWQLTFRVFPAQVAAGACTAHAEALSALISLYLHSMVAAPEEEILTVLAPFATYSKLREVVHGLGSMRQLDIVDVSGRPHLSLQGESVPEAPEQAEAQPDSSEVSPTAVHRKADTQPKPRAYAPRPDRPARRAGFGNRSSEDPRFPKKKFVSRHSSGSERREPMSRKPGARPFSKPRWGDDRQEKKESSRGRSSFRSGGFKPPTRRRTPGADDAQRETRPRKEAGAPFYQNLGPRRNVKEDRPRSRTNRTEEKPASPNRWGNQRSESPLVRRQESFGKPEQRPWKAKGGRTGAARDHDRLNRRPRRNGREDNSRTGNNRAEDKSVPGTRLGKQRSELPYARRGESFGAKERRPWNERRQRPADARSPERMGLGKPRFSQERPFRGKPQTAKSPVPRTDSRRRSDRFGDFGRPKTSDRPYSERRSPKAPQRSSSAESRRFRGDRTERPHRPAGAGNRKPFGSGNTRRRPSPGGQAQFRRNDNDKGKSKSNRGKS